MVVRVNMLAADYCWLVELEVTETDAAMVREVIQNKNLL